MLNALALPAARVPPIRVATIKPKEGTPSSAKIIAGIVEIKSSSTTRSFIRAIYARRRAMAQDYPANFITVHRVL
jgi:hypothetical protein